MKKDLVLTYNTTSSGTAGELKVEIRAALRRVQGPQNS